MPKKLTVNTVAEVLKNEAIAPASIRSVIEKLNLMTQSDEGEKPPTEKKQFSVIVSDPDGKLPKDYNWVCWVVQLPENESVATTEERIRRAARDYNASKKGRLLPVSTVGEALENVASKYFKESELWVKTRTPVLVLRTDNEIPKAAKSDGDLKDERRIEA